MGRSHQKRPPMTGAVVAQREANKHELGPFVTIPPNEVFEGLLDAMKRYGKAWYLHIHYHDCARVLMCLYGMRNQLDGYWSVAAQAEAKRSVEGVEQMQAGLDIRHANPYAEQVAEQFERNTARPGRWPRKAERPRAYKYE